MPLDLLSVGARPAAEQLTDVRDIWSRRTTGRRRARPGVATPHGASHRPPWTGWRGLSYRRACAHRDAPTGDHRRASAAINRSRTKTAPSTPSATARSSTSASCARARAPRAIASDRVPTARSLVHLYEEYRRRSFVQQLDGMYGFALWDEPAAQRLLLGRDRLGIKPLYYWHDGTFRVRVRGQSPARAAASPSSISTALRELLTFGYVPGAHSIFARHPAAPARRRCSSLEGGRSEFARYWPLPRGTDETLSEDDWVAGGARADGGSRRRADGQRRADRCFLERRHRLEQRSSR